MSFTSQHFIIDGINSSDIGVDGCSLIRTDSEINYPIMGQKSIVQDKIRYRNIPYFYTVDKDVITFDLKFSLLDGEFNEDRIYELGTIFAKDHYVSFKSCDFLGKEFFVICTSMNLITFGSYKGWMECKLEHCANFAFSELEISTFDFSDLTTTQTFEIYAKFNVDHPKYGSYYFPKLLIDMKGAATSITINNQSDGNRSFGFTSLTTLESLEIDNELKQISSSTSNYRLNNMINNHAFFRLIQGRNTLTINSPSVIQVQSRYGIYI
jgi:phage-related protein